MSHLTQWKKEVKQEFADHFLYHPAGVWRNGKLEQPDFRPLTFDNVNAFLDTLIDRTHAHTLEEVKGIAENVIDGAREDGETDLRGIKSRIISELELLVHPTD